MSQPFSLPLLMTQLPDPRAEVSYKFISLQEQGISGHFSHSRNFSQHVLITPLLYSRHDLLSMD